MGYYTQLLKNYIFALGNTEQRVVAFSEIFFRGIQDRDALLEAAAFSRSLVQAGQQNITEHTIELGVSTNSTARTVRPAGSPDWFQYGVGAVTVTGAGGPSVIATPVYVWEHATPTDAFFDLQSFFPGRDPQRTIVNTDETYKPGNQIDAEIGALKGSGYVVVWTSATPVDPNNSNVTVNGWTINDDVSDVRFQIFNGAGAPVGAEHSIRGPGDLLTRGAQYAPNVAGLVNGGFVVSWQSVDSTLAPLGTFVATYSAAGVETRLLSVTTAQVIDSHVHATNNGDFALVTQEGANTYVVRLFDPLLNQKWTSTFQGVHVSVVGNGDVLVLTLDGGDLVMDVLRPNIVSGFSFEIRAEDAVISDPSTPLRGPIHSVSVTEVGDDRVGITWMEGDYSASQYLDLGPLARQAQYEPTTSNPFIHALADDVHARFVNDSWREGDQPTKTVIGVYLDNSAIINTHSYGPLPGVNWMNFGANEPGGEGNDWIRAALESFESVLNVDFRFVDYVDNANIVFHLTNKLPPGVGGFSYTPGNLGDNGVYEDTVLRMDQTMVVLGIVANLQYGNETISALTHELGHAIGLSHAHDDKNDRLGFPGLFSGDFEFNYLWPGDNGLNNTTFSTMSYRRVDPVTGQALGDGTWNNTLMAFDIAALQYVYGANATANSGDDTYLLPDPNIIVVGDRYASDHDKGWQTVWDTDGNDTIEYSGQLGAHINLNPATLDNSPSGGGGDRLSYAGIGQSGGLIIAGTYEGPSGAIAVEIENAIGGSGDDQITGNALDNLLVGNNGSDTIYGGNGADAIYGGGDNDYLFSDGGGGVLDGGAGDDELTAGQWVEMPETLLGGDGNDVIKDVGHGRADTVDAGAGDDEVHVSRVANAVAQVTLGSGRDLVVLDGASVLAGGVQAIILDAFSGEGDAVDVSDLLTYTIGEAGDGSGHFFLSQEGGDTMLMLDLDAAGIAFAPFAILNLRGAADVILSFQQGSVLVGDDAAEVITGAVGAQRIFGGGGDDTLGGGAGNDRVDGDGGNDRLSGGAGDDVLRGGAGVDVAQFSGNRGDYSITRTANDWNAYIITDLRSGSPDGTDTVSGIEAFDFADGTVRDPDLINDAPFVTGFLKGELARTESYTVTFKDLEPIDPEGETAFTFAVSGVLHGAVLVDGVSATTFTSAQVLAGLVVFDHNGSGEPLAGFDISVVDSGGVASTPKFFRIDVAMQNHAPVGAATAALPNAMESTPVTISAAQLAEGFSDPDGDALQVTSAYAAYGSATLNADGSVTVTPYPYYYGPNTVFYELSDGFGGTVSGSLDYEIIDNPALPANEPPYFQDISGDGIVVTDPRAFNPDYTQFWGQMSVLEVVAQSDGRIVALATYGGQLTPQFALLRYSEDGVVDTSFGDGALAVSGAYEIAHAGKGMVALNSGAIVVASHTFDGLVLSGFTAEGGVNAAFGAGGQERVIVQHNGSGGALEADTEFAGMISLQDGTFIVALNWTVDDPLGGTTRGARVAHYSAAGDLIWYSDYADITVVDLAAGADWQSVRGIAMDADDPAMLRIFNLGGETSPALHVAPVLGLAGVLPSNITFDAHSAALDADGHLIVGGNFERNSDSFDASLGFLRVLDNGVVEAVGYEGGLGVPGFWERGVVAVQADGRIVVAGVYANGDNPDFGIVRYNADGSVDASFGSPVDHTVRLDRSSFDVPESLTILPDGDILVVGVMAPANAQSSGASQYALVRLNTDGSLHVGFDAGAPVLFLHGGPPVVMDDFVSALDWELSSANNYDHASLTIARIGGASAEDEFGASGALIMAGGAVYYEDTLIGAVSQSGGVLTITFNGNATYFAVAGALSSLTYANVGEADATIRIGWSFSDGYVGPAGVTPPAQGVITIDVQSDAANMAPEFADGEEQTVSFAENDAAPAALVSASDADGDTLTYDIVGPNEGGGPDAALFAVDADTGALQFLSTPDFENPTDANADNTYEVTVRVSDGRGGADSQLVRIAVSDVLGVTILGTNAANTINATTTVAGQPLPTNEQDTISGLGGADTISGLGGADTIRGGAGNDALAGGAGNDVFLYAMGDGADVLDAGEGNDVLEISGGAANDALVVQYDGVRLVRVAGGAVENVESVRVDLGAGTNTLSYAGAGTLTSVSVNLALGLASGLSALGGIANVTGGNFADTLIGDGGANVLLGGSGDDMLVGGQGADTLNGGAGVDTVSYAGEADAFAVDLATGAATRGGQTGVEDTLVGVENIDFGAGNDEATGSSAANVLTGSGGADTLRGGAGDDRLDGGADNDILAGGLGKDAVFGGDGDDRFLYAMGDGADSVDGGAGADILEITGASGDELLVVAYDGQRLTLAASSSLTNVETISADLAGGVNTLSYAGSGTLTSVAVDLAAHTAPGFASILNVANVTGSAFSDILIGDANNNVLAGGNGDDALSGGLGADTLNGGGGADTASYADEQAAIWADLLSGSMRRGDALAPIEDTLISIERLIGGAGDDDLNGSNGANVLVGGAGADTIHGASGADTLQGGDDNDTLIGDAGSDVVFGGAGDDLVVFAIADGADTIDGGADFDTLRILGGVENDTLDIVWDGASLTRVESASVTNIEAINADLGGGLNTLSYSSASVTAGIELNLAAQVASGFAAIINVANVTGSRFADVLIGDAAANVLLGGSGDDVLNGGLGVDTLNGGAGLDTVSFANETDSIGIDLAAGVSRRVGVTEDVLASIENAIGGDGADDINGSSGVNVLDGGAGADVIHGGAGNDTLRGGADQDTLIGGAGFDLLFGDAGADAFVFATMQEIGNGVATGARERIGDFEQGLDLIDLSQLDASTLVAGDQAFDFLAAPNAAFTGAHQIRFYVEGSGAEARTVIEGNINSNLAPDFRLELAGLYTLQAGDFIL